MKRALFVSLACAAMLHAATITDLFEALKQSPHTKYDEWQVKYLQSSTKSVRSRLYPSVDLFATYEHYTSATNLRPVPPTETAILQKKGEPLPFAKTIERIGSEMSMPLFAKELYENIKKLKSLTKSAQAKKRLNFLKREAALLASDAAWIANKKLQEATRQRKKSLQKSYDDLKIKVKSGRSAPIALDKIEEALNTLDIALNNIAIQESSLKNSIFSLVNKELNEPIPFEKRKMPSFKDIFVLKPLEYAIDSKRYGIKAAQAKLWPKLALSANYTENYAQKDVFRDDDVHRSYGKYMLALRFPLFDKTNYADIEKAKVDFQKERYNFLKAKQDIVAQTKTLKQNLHLLERSILLAKRSVKNQKKLLEYAKVAFNLGRLDEEEYLRYEDALLQAQAKVYETEAKWWQNFANLAVIYGNDLENLVQ